MENAVATAQEVMTESSPVSSGLWGYLVSYGYRILILVAVTVFLVYALLYLRKRFPIVREFAAFLKERKLWWMMPIVIIFLLLALIIVTMESSVIAPFIYPIFG